MNVKRTMATNSVVNVFSVKEELLGTDKNVSLSVEWTKSGMVKLVYVNWTLSDWNPHVWYVAQTLHLIKPKRNVFAIQVSYGAAGDRAV